jgi:hypothetical protein
MCVDQLNYLQDPLRQLGIGRLDKKLTYNLSSGERMNAAEPFFFNLNEVEL